MEIFREQNLKVESPAAALKAARRFPGYQVFSLGPYTCCMYAFSQFSSPSGLSHLPAGKAFKGHRKLLYPHDRWTDSGGSQSIRHQYTRAATGVILGVIIFRPGTAAKMEVKIENEKQIISITLIASQTSHLSMAALKIEY